MAPGCQLPKGGAFGASPLCGQLPASKKLGRAGSLYDSRIYAYGCFGTWLLWVTEVVSPATQTRKVPLASRHPIPRERLGPDGVVTLNGVIFSARGILLLAPPGFDE